MCLYFLATFGEIGLLFIVPSGHTRKCISSKKKTNWNSDNGKNYFFFQLSSLSFLFQKSTFLFSKLSTLYVDWEHWLNEIKNARFNFLCHNIYSMWISHNDIWTFMSERKIGFRQLMTTMSCFRRCLKPILRLLINVRISLQEIHMKYIVTQKNTKKTRILYLVKSMLPDHI